ncbi:MAG: hypothetical protein EBR82_38650 [Caulobacteraceae bacterium]|nr:hypothetical protein [Caulobacteraceae bacterium]
MRLQPRGRLARTLELGPGSMAALECQDVGEAGELERAAVNLDRVPAQLLRHGHAVGDDRLL